MQETLASREWIIARISSTEEAVATGGEVSLKREMSAGANASLLHIILLVSLMGCGTGYTVSKNTTLLLYVQGVQRRLISIAD